MGVLKRILKQYITDVDWCGFFSENDNSIVVALMWCLKYVNIVWNSIVYERGNEYERGITCGQCWLKLVFSEKLQHGGLNCSGEGKGESKVKDVFEKLWLVLGCFF